MKLTEKQRRFADYYIETANATEAALMAGYSKNTAKFIGHENLNKPYLKEFIDKRLESKEKERIASQDEILSYFTRVMRGQSLSEVVVVEGKGMGISEAKTIEKFPDEKERIAAAKELAKRYGIDKPEEANEMDGVKIEW